ncbi:replication initiator [Streptomyces sp. NPDC092296]|uniref:replication initiator n=1 Tax=Streptomyces sp. NPDC092296 TaxID=3366012 RepID=UPI0037F528B8
MTDKPLLHANPFESAAARRVYLVREERMRTLGEVERGLLRLGQMPDLARWVEQITATGGCAQPVYLAGESTTYDPVTGEVLRRYTTRDEPGERLAVRCRNRRAARCEPCSWQYQGDTWQLVRAGLAGGKGVPADVRTHPMVFLTLTAPSFGRVHRAGECHAARPGGCGHGASLGCGGVHRDADPVVGQPLCPGCYDYAGHVLWNGHASALWKAFGDNLYHHLAVRAGVGRSAVRKLVRVSAAKVAEYQRRGVVHFHAVLRLDGPDGPGEAPAPWATVALLLEAVRSAAAAVALRAPESAAYGSRRLRFGEQLDAHPITGGDGVLSDERVAGYVAKYTTKSAAEAGAVDRRVTSVAEIRALRVSAHVRALVGMCWRLGGLLELGHLRLKLWAHMLGYRGHCLTKTRRYSTTFRELRGERAEHARAVSGRALFTSDEAVTVGSWRFVGSGLGPAEMLIAAGIADDLKRTREIARDHLPFGWVGGARRAPWRAGGGGHAGTADDG